MLAVIKPRACPQCLSWCMTQFPDWLENQNAWAVYIGCKGHWTMRGIDFTLSVLGNLRPRGETDNGHQNVNRLLTYIVSIWIQNEPIAKYKSPLHFGRNSLLSHCNRKRICNTMVGKRGPKNIGQDHLYTDSPRNHSRSDYFFWDSPWEWGRLLFFKAICWPISLDWRERDLLFDSRTWK